MTPEDPYKGMPIWLQQAAQRNLRAVDRSVDKVNQAGRQAVTQIPTATPVPAPISTPINFTLGGPIDTSLGTAQLPPVTTAASRVSTPTPSPSPIPTGENFSGHMVNPRAPGTNEAYNQTTFKPSQSYQDWQEKHEQRRRDYGWSHANP